MINQNILFKFQIYINSPNLDHLLLLTSTNDDSYKHDLHEIFE